MDRMVDLRASVPVRSMARDAFRPWRRWRPAGAEVGRTCSDRGDHDIGCRDALSDELLANVGDGRRHVGDANRVYPVNSEGDGN